MKKYFGTDGIRGDAKTKVTNMLGYMVGNSLKSTFDIDTVVIGMDTRESSPLLLSSLAWGAQRSGMEVLNVYTATTPMIAHYSKIRGILGVMITASHNPYTDNGIKVFNKGFKTTPEEEEKIENHIDAQQILGEKIYDMERGKDDVTTQYKRIYTKLNPEKSDLRVAYDTANGATSRIAKEIFGLYAPNAIQIFDFDASITAKINDNCGSTHMESIVNYVTENQLFAGFSFDGDGDRIQAVDNKGTIYDGDLIVYMIANHMKSHGTLKNNGVVLTIMSNLGIINSLKSNGIDVVLSDVGDKYVSLAMEKHGYCIGGESSGHVILNQFIHTGDGVLIAMYLLKILTETKKTFEELTKDITLYPVEHINISDVSKEVLKKDSIQNYIKQLKEELGEDSLLLVRPSGTENLIRVTISHQDESLVKKATKDLVSFIHKEGELL